jgi:hypothetical protein
MPGLGRLAWTLGTMWKRTASMISSAGKARANPGARQPTAAAETPKTISSPLVAQKSVQVGIASILGPR